MSEPLFSVILPTYNRAFILPLAIQSVLDQTCGDFELIVNNSASTDQTRDVVQGFGDDRIRYFETETRLGMADNYEAALEHASGRYVVFFSDDDALVPVALERIADLISETEADMVVFPFARFFHENDDAGNRENSLLIPNFTSTIEHRSSAAEIDLMAGKFGLKPSTSENPLRTEPLIGNVVYRRAISDSLKSRVGRLFATVPVDIYFIRLLMAEVAEYYVLDEPLLVWSQWRRNSSVFIAKNIRQHYEGLLNGSRLEEVPLASPLPINCSANAVLAAERAIGAAPTELDRNRYFSLMYETLVYLDAEGVDVRREFGELEEALARESETVREFLNDRKRNIRFLVSQKIKKLAPGLFHILRSVASKLRPSKQEGMIVLGEKAGFSNVLESAHYVSSILTKAGC